MKPNFFERALSVISPRAAADRLSYRRAFREMARAYDGGKAGRRTEGWVAHGTSANAEIGPWVARLRARSRDMVRNSAWGARAGRVIKSNVVGVGITPYLSSGSPDDKKLVMDQYQAFVENCDPAGMLDFYGIQALIMNTVFESGEALVRVRLRPSSWALDVPVQLEVLEPDFVDFEKNEALKDGGVIIQGVEFDRHGRRRAYWMFPEHPGEAIAGFGRNNFVSRRVPAEEIIPVFDVLRPGQVHGVPWVAPVIMKMRDLDDYDDAELVRKKIEACFVAFVKNQGVLGHGGLTGQAAKNSQGELQERLSPGRIFNLKDGQEVSFGAPAAFSGYSDYMYTQLHAIAAGIGVTYEQLTGDLKAVNYGSMRGGKVEFWQILDMWQNHMMVHQLCRRIWSAIDQNMVFLGKRPPGFSRANWTPPVRAWVDPLKDEQAEENAIRAGLKTLRQSLSTRGRDPDQHLAEIAEINQILDEKGLKLTTDARVDMKSTEKVAAAGGAGEEDDAEKTSKSDD